VRVNYINDGTGGSMAISYNEITGILAGTNWDATAFAGMQFDGYELVRVDGDPITGSDIQSNQVINVYYRQIDVPATEPAIPTTETTTRGSTTEPAPEETTEPSTEATTEAAEEITTTEPAVETTTIAETTTEELVEAEGLDATVPLAGITAEDRPPSLQNTERAIIHIPAPTEAAIAEHPEEEAADAPVPRGNFPDEEDKQNPQTGDSIPLVLLAAMALAGAAAFGYLKKRAK
jgi:LPXTG-motif cell wall-anchored protein